MIKKVRNKIITKIQRYRYRVLLMVTLMVLITPAFFGDGNFSAIVFLILMSFLYIQSMIATTETRSKFNIRRYIAVLLMITILWLEPAGIMTGWLQLLKLVFLLVFFGFIITKLVLFIRKSDSVNINVIMVAITIYLLIGILAGNLAFVLHLINSEAYSFPSSIPYPRFIDFVYYSFITLASVGYGDITPAITETRTLAFIIAITGQMYLTIIMAIIVGKFITSSKKNGE